MSRYLLVFLCFILTSSAMAQDEDTLFAVKKGKTWTIKYTVQARETLPMLAHRFYITESKLEYANDPDELKNMTTGSVIYIPVTKENYYTTKPVLDVANTRELHYHVAAKDDINLLSTYAGITKNDMRAWNNLHGNTLTIDQVLFIGWIKMMGKDSTNPDAIAAYPVKKKKVVADTAKVVVLGGLDTVYNRQTSNGTNVLTEKGTAVFFEKPGKPAVYYAFHNSTPRGSVIKVYNPGTGKTIYVKVLDKLPNTKLYANSIIGICDAAKEALGITDSKAWCELTYSPE